MGVFRGLKQIKKYEERRKQSEEQRVPTLSIRRWSKRRETKLSRRIEKDWRVLRKGLAYYEG